MNNLKKIPKNEMIIQFYVYKIRIFILLREVAKKSVISWTVH